VLFLIRHHFFRCSKIVAKRKDIGQGRRSFIYTARAARGRGHVFDCVEGRSARTTRLCPEPWRVRSQRVSSPCGHPKN
jgi:hypothetical protein